MTELIIIILILLFVLTNLTNQHLRRKKYFEMKTEIIFETKNRDDHYWVRAFICIILTMYLLQTLSIQHFNFLKFAIAILAYIIGILFWIESRNTFAICDNGIFFPNQFIEWNDIVCNKWKVMGNGDFQKFILTSKRSSLVFLFKKYDLIVKISISEKSVISEIINENVKSVV